jgi:hypothetical protein
MRAGVSSASRRGYIAFTNPFARGTHQRCVSSRAPRFLTSVKNLVQKASMLCRVVAAGSDLD